MTAKHRLTAAAIAALLLGCAEQRDSTDAARSYVREVTGDLKGRGRLLVTTSGVTTDGRIAKIRGTVQNSFDEPVEGVRYVVIVYEAGPTPKVLFRWQHEADTAIEPGERKAMSLNVESLYFGSSGGSRLRIDAQPVRLGSREMPPPEGWSN
jgi:hypothetical protein